MNYLIYRNDGIGDLIVSTPLIKLIKIYDKNANIHLVCSNRNIDLAYILKSNKFIEDYTNIDEYSSFFGKIKFYLRIKSVNPHHIIILKSNHLSLLISQIFKFTHGITKKISISSIVPLNLSKKGKNRYKPNKFLIDIIFNHYEIIDCRNDYLKSKNIHMFEHYIRLGNKILESEIITNNNDYFIPQSLLIEKNFVKTIHKILNKNKFMIFHFDEKWNATNYSIDEIINLINGLLKIFEGNIFMTHGLFENKYHDIIKNKYKLNRNIEVDLDCKISQSEVNNRLFSFNNLKLKDLMYLISKSNFVIEPHGALSHVASIYKIPVLDLIPKNENNILSKWKPRNTKMKQIVIDDREEILKTTREFIS